MDTQKVRAILNCTTVWQFVTSDKESEARKANQVSAHLQSPCLLTLWLRQANRTLLSSWTIIMFQ